MSSGEDVELTALAINVTIPNHNGGPTPGAVRGSG
jgi:hypothetical protein